MDDTVPLCCGKFNKYVKNVKQNEGGVIRREE